MDDVLDPLHALMATKLLAKAERMGIDAELKALPQLRKAAKKVAAAVDVLMTTPPATDTGALVSVVDAWSAIEQVVPREQLAEALGTVASVVPDSDGDGDAEWRAELVARYGTMRGFIRLLVEVIDFGAVEAGAPVVQALKRLPELIGRKKVGAEEVAADLMTGSRRRLVFANPNVPHGLVDKATYSFCVLVRETAPALRVRLRWDECAETVEMRPSDECWRRARVPLPGVGECGDGVVVRDDVGGRVAEDSQMGGEGVVGLLDREGSEAQPAARTTRVTFAPSWRYSWAAARAAFISGRSRTRVDRFLEQLVYTGGFERVGPCNRPEQRSQPACAT